MTLATMHLSQLERQIDKEFDDLIINARFYSDKGMFRSVHKMTSTVLAHIYAKCQNHEEWERECNRIATHLDFIENDIYKERYADLEDDLKYLKTALLKTIQRKDRK